MAVIVTFGEIMLRLSPPGRERLFQSPVLGATFGGGEANVAVSLARFGHEARYVSVVPANDLGDAAVRELGRWGVDTSRVVRAGRRLGIYFAETGAAQRPSKVIYDREGSAIAQAGPGAIDWDRAFEGASWFHVTGITPALGRGAADLTIEAVRVARAKGVTVSVDLNYRSKLWAYGAAAVEVMPEIVKSADLLVANEEDCQKALGMGGAADIVAGRLDPALYEDLTARAMAAYANLSRVAVTLRESRGADDNGWSAVLRNRNEFMTGPRFDIRPIVDRIGAGDAFAAGLIHGLIEHGDDRRALAFAVAAGCLKHSIPGDFNLASAAEVEAVAAGDVSGRVRR